MKTFDCLYGKGRLKKTGNVCKVRGEHPTYVCVIFTISAKTHLKFNYKMTAKTELYSIRRVKHMKT